MSLAIEPGLIRALTTLPPGEEPVHLRLARATGRRSDNTLVTLKKYAEAGWLDSESFQPTPALKGMFGEGSQAGSGLTTPNTVPLDQLSPSGLNYRKTFDEAALEDLANSILAQGQLQNLLVRPDTDFPDGHYQVIAGERRYRAFKRLVERGDLPEDTPVRVEIRALDDAGALEAAITENADREDVDKLEEAAAYARLKAIYEARGSDSGQATADIADRLGCTRRLVQRRIRTIERIIPEVRQAWNEGKIPSFAMAEELSRWPEAVQKDALREIHDGWDAPKDAKELRDWLEEDAPIVGEQPFELQTYIDEGGTFIEPETDDQPRRFADKALAEHCTTEWCKLKAAEINLEQGYGGDPIFSSYYHNYSWPHARTAPAELKSVFFKIEQATLKVDVIHPVARREALEAHREARQKAQAGKDGPAPAMRPYARKNWLNGAAQRTERVRAAIEADPQAAMALTVLALLPGDWEGSWNDSAPLWINRVHPAGDASTIGFDGSFKSSLVANPCPGINFEEGDHWPVKDRELAMRSLMAREDLPMLFAELIADLTIDCSYTAKPGSTAECRAIMDGKPAITGLQDSDDWLQAYSKDQLVAHAEAAGRGSQVGAADTKKKAELIEAVGAALPADWTPPEVKFTDAAAMQAEVDKVLSWGTPS